MKQIRTPQGKMIEVAAGFGQKNIAKQQGTTRIIYDTLEMTAGNDIYNFFQNVNTRQFPFTNMQNGNKLEVGEMLTLMFAWINIMAVIPDETGAPAEYRLYDLSGTSFGHAIVDGNNVTAPTWTAVENYLRSAAKIALGELSFMVGNTQILKPISLTAFHPTWNKSAKNEHGSVFTFDSMLTVPPLLEFIAPVKVIPFSAADLSQEVKLYLRLTLEGAAAIVAPRQTF